MFAGFGEAFGFAEKVELGALWAATFGWHDGLRMAVGEDQMSVAGIGKTLAHQSDEAAFQRRGLDRDHQLDTAIQVAAHPVCGSDEDFGLGAVLEGENAGMLKIAIDDRNDADVFRVTFVRWFEAADAADVELDGNAGLRGFIEGCDDIWVLQGVDFGKDAGGFAEFGALGGGGDKFEKSALHLRGRGHQTAESEQLGSTCDSIEEE